MFPSMDFNQYAVGSKVYNGGSNAPHRGRLGAKLGAESRKLETQTRRNALLRRLQASQKGQHMNSDWLGGPRA